MECDYLNTKPFPVCVGDYILMTKSNKHAATVNEVTGDDSHTMVVNKDGAVYRPA